MALIASHRHTRADLEHWRQCEAMDRAYVERCARRLDELEERAIATIGDFAARGPCYVGVSWGKDSTVVADLALMAVPTMPLIWFPAGAIENPDCGAVRDVFLAARPGVRYFEIGVPSDGDPDSWDVSSTSARRITGLRAEESGARRISARADGATTARSCRPLLGWTAADVFGYLCRYDLPVNPAYACTMAGALDRARVRVGPIGGMGGAGHGRAEWERRYYPEIAAGARSLRA